MYLCAPIMEQEKHVSLWILRTKVKKRKVMNETRSTSMPLQKISFIGTMIWKMTINSYL